MELLQLSDNEWIIPSELEAIKKDPSGYIFIMKSGRQYVNQNYAHIRHLFPNQTELHLKHSAETYIAKKTFVTHDDSKIEIKEGLKLHRTLIDHEVKWIDPARPGEVQFSFEAITNKEFFAAVGPMPAQDPTPTIEKKPITL